MWLLLLNPCINELYQTFNEGLNFQTLCFDSRWLPTLGTTTSGSLKETDSILLALELLQVALTLDSVEGARNQAGLLEKN